MGKAEVKKRASNIVTDDDINGCLTKLAEKIKPYIKTGVPELNIPQADPLLIDSLDFELKNALIDVKVDFTDNEITGLSEHELVYIKVNKKAKTIAMKMFLPSSTAVGKYVISGKVAVLELEAEAPADYTTEFTNTTVEGVAKLAVKTINGVERLVIVEDPKITIELGDLNIKLDNL